jgi:anti-sigma B factor antagonist
MNGEHDMDITQKMIGDVTVVEITGEIDGSTAPEAQAAIVPLAQDDAKVVIDMSGVGYMSSAGLRMLLVVYRTVAGQGGAVALAGLSQDLEDTMSLTGFLDFFDHFSTVEDAVAAVE